ncbi:hypothetical protein ACKKBG_A02320 [Auxenochlorella protothecoides x Auxenochlorella symbiontica]
MGIEYLILVATCVVVMSGGLIMWLARDLRLRRCWQRGFVPAALLMRVHPQQVPEGTTLDEYAVVARTPATLADLGEGACPVCLGKYLRTDASLVLGCRHSLCTACLHRILLTQRLEARCPLCRHALVERGHAAGVATGGKPGHAGAKGGEAATTQLTVVPPA